MHDGQAIHDHVRLRCTKDPEAVQERSAHQQILHHWVRAILLFVFCLFCESPTFLICCELTEITRTWM